MSEDKQNTENVRARVLAAYWMQKQLGKYVADHKAAFMRELGPGDSLSGRYDLDGQELPLGKITRTEPRPAWKVKKPDDLLEWAQDNMPGLVDYVAVLKPDAVDALVKEVANKNAAVTEDGEVIPGIEWDNTGGSYIRYTPAKTMGNTLGLLSHEGKLGELLDGMLEIEQ